MNVNKHEKTVLLFPGLDAIFSSAKMKMWLENKKIRDCLSEASIYLSQCTGVNEDLAKFIQSHKHIHLADFDRTLVALTSLQVGIARLIDQPWHIVQGCSHGDIARAVITESISFKESIELLWLFAELRKIAPKGYTANVRAKDGSALSQEVLLWLKDHEAPASLWSETHATIGGTEATLAQIISESGLRSIKVKPVLQFPVHSPAMRSTMALVTEMTKNYRINAPNQPVFSSVWVKYLQTADDVRSEALASSIQEVRWVETLTYLHQHEGATKFINVGPSNTLTSWLFNCQQFNDLKVIESWDLV